MSRVLPHALRLHILFTGKDIYPVCIENARVDVISPLLLDEVVIAQSVQNLNDRRRRYVTQDQRALE